jgi:heme exporter protein B
MTRPNALGARKQLSYASKTFAVIRKDALEEFRARYAVNSTLLFCVTCMMVVSFSLGGSVSDPRLQSALLWVILFFSSMMGLPRAFIKEEDRGTMNTLRLVCEPSHVYLGKTITNLILLAAVMVIVTPLYIIFLNVTLRHAGFFALTMFFSAVGLTAVSTLLSAVVAQARARGTLFPVLVFPVLMPVFLIAVDATGRALSAPSPWDHANLLVFLVCYAVATLVGGTFLFEYVFSE